jgi:short-subunit dehydrogenase
MTTVTQSHPVAVVTGASSGIGAAFAERLARDQYNLIITARRRARLEDLAKRLHEKYNVSVEILAADLSLSGNLRAVEQRIADDKNLELLVNNAGFGAYMPFVELDPDRAEELIRLQVIAVTRLTRAALPGMIAKGRGTIINVSSRLGFSAGVTTPNLPMRATYVGTKAFINAFTQLLKEELKGTGVRVQALCPGVVRTEFHELVGRDMSKIPVSMVMSPEDVVQASLASLELGELFCLPMLNVPGSLEKVFEAQQKFFDEGASGVLAERYRAPKS